MQLSLHLPQGQQTQPAQTGNPTAEEGNQASADSSHEVICQQHSQHTPLQENLHDRSPRNLRKAGTFHNCLPWTRLIPAAASFPCSCVHDVHGSEGEVQLPGSAFTTSLRVGADHSFSMWPFREQILPFNIICTFEESIFQNL